MSSETVERKERLRQMKAGYTPKNLRDFISRFERDEVQNMKPEQWGAWVDALPVPEFMAMCCMKQDTPEHPHPGILTVGEFTTAVMRQSRDDLGRLEAENARLRDALKVPDVWSEEERDGMSDAFIAAGLNHGHYETMFATVAWLLRHRSARALSTTEAGG